MHCIDLRSIVTPHVENKITNEDIDDVTHTNRVKEVIPISGALELRSILLAVKPDKLDKERVEGET